MNNILTTNSNKKFTNMTKVEQKLTRTLDFSDKEFKTPDLTTKIRKNLDVSLGYSNERGILGQMHSYRSSGSSRSGSKRSLRNSYELRSHSPIERKKDTEEYYMTLKSQISEKEKQAKEQKEMKKLEDAEYLGLMINHFPFGKMGAGAPLRDKNGHILAERGHMSDKDTNETPVLYSPKEAYNSFSNQKQPDKTKPKKFRVPRLTKLFECEANEIQKQKEKDEWKEYLKKEKIRNCLKTRNVSKWKRINKIQRELAEMRLEYLKESRNTTINPYSSPDVGNSKGSYMIIKSSSKSPRMPDIAARPQPVAQPVSQQKSWQDLEKCSKSLIDINAEILERLNKMRNEVREMYFMFL